MKQCACLTPELDGNVTGVPGDESVTKQFVYQSAYRGFVKVHGFTRVVSAFRALSAGGRIVHTRHVRFLSVIANEEPPFSNVVELYALPASMVFDAYLVGTPLENAELLEVIG